MPATSRPSASRCVTEGRSAPAACSTGMRRRSVPAARLFRTGSASRRVDPDPARAVLGRGVASLAGGVQRGDGRRDQHGPGGLQQFTAVHGRSRNAGNYGTIWAPMPRTLILAVPVALLLASIAPTRPLDAARGRQAPSPPRPNIVLVQADDLGYGDLSAYGQAQFQTPSLDRLAADGIRFTEYYAGSTVCAPSRTALMTGLHTGHAWIRGNGEIPLRDEDTTVAMALRDAGYRTAVVGKWGLGKPGTGGDPAKKGFDYAFGFLDHRHAHRQFTDHLFRNGEPVPTDLERDYVNDLFTREAAAFIENPDTRPFFLYLNYTVPHAELRVPEDSLAPMRGKFAETPFVNATADGQADRARQPVARVSIAADAEGGLRRDDHADGSRHRRRCAIGSRARGLEQRTLFMFISDNGPAQGRRRAIPHSSRAPAACAASSATSTKGASACR